MRITKLTISSHFGDNKAPGSGVVTFSDGKDFLFSWDHHEEAYTLARHARMAGRSVLRDVRAPKRVGLLKARLDA